MTNPPCFVVKSSQIQSHYASRAALLSKTQRDEEESSTTIPETGALLGTAKICPDWKSVTGDLMEGECVDRGEV
jgi:hypothetical protein